MTPTGPRLRTQPQRTDAWYVTASHRVMRPHANGQREVPFDVGHLRQVGAAFTARGKPAMHWQIFWDLPAGEVEPCARNARRRLRLFRCAQIPWVSSRRRRSRSADGPEATSSSEF